MVVIYASENALLAWNIANHLEAHGIRCQVANQGLQSGVGTLAPIDCWTKVQLLRDQDETEARQLLQRYESKPDAANERCPNCGEQSEAQFACCWNCGEPLTLDSDAQTAMESSDSSQ